MKKYAVLQGFHVVNFIDHPEKNLEIEGLNLVDVTDLPDLPSIGDLFINQTFSTPLHLQPENIIEAEVVEETKAIGDTPTDKK